MINLFYYILCKQSKQIVILISSNFVMNFIGQFYLIVNKCIKYVCKYKQTRSNLIKNFNFSE